MPTFSRGVSVVIPVYNSEDLLKPLVERLGLVLELIGYPFELILVNDGSRDDSWTTIQALSASRNWIRGINLMRNYGQHNALLCGVRAARYAITITMDDDLQNPPEEIPRLLVALTSSHDVVYGISYDPHHGKLREITSRLAKLIMKKALGAEIPFRASSFRAFHTYLREAFSEYKDPFVSIDVLLTWGSKDLTYVVVRQDPRLLGKSNYTIPRLVVHALNMITGFSSLPLRIASLFGFVFVLFGVAVLVYVVGRFFIEGDSVPGFPFLASLIAIFSGVQLFSLGIMGEYIARIHFRTMDRPQYSVREESLSK